jgi:hypothetical protein
MATAKLSKTQKFSISKSKNKVILVTFFKSHNEFFFSTRLGGE